MIKEKQINGQIDIFGEIYKEIEEVTKKKVTTKKKTKAEQKEYDLLEFKRILNQNPPAKIIKVNPNYGNKFIPLQVIEIMLNAIFESFQITMDIPPMFIESNIVFFVNVIVKHPVTGEILTYAGTSAVPIKDKDGKLTDIHTNLPAGKSYAIMNAVKHAGPLFRAESDDYTKIFDSYFEKKQTEKEDPALDRMKKMIDSSGTREILGKLHKKALDLGLKDYWESKEIKLIHKNN